MPAVAALLLALGAPEGHAAGDLRGTALVQWTTDYTYHGYTKSDHGPAVQLHGALSHAGGAYAGAWLSQVDFGGAALEVLPYVGLHRALHADLSCDAALGAYVFDDRVFGHTANYAEVYARCDWQQWLNMRIGYAPDAYGRGHALHSYELGARWPLSDVLEATAGGGYVQARKLFEYDVVHWGAGLRYFVGGHAAFELRYVDSHYVNELAAATHTSPFEALQADDRFVFSLSVGF